jgi:hypothetical protein
VLFRSGGVCANAAVAVVCNEEEDEDNSILEGIVSSKRVNNDSTKDC